jgi:hypothetical protein
MECQILGIQVEAHGRAEGEYGMHSLNRIAYCTPSIRLPHLAPLHESESDTSRIYHSFQARNPLTLMSAYASVRRGIDGADVGFQVQ